MPCAALTMPFLSSHRIRLKQNKYPVMFLTQGVTEKYPMYNDPICQTIPMAIHYAISSNILASIITHSPVLVVAATFFIV